MNRFVRPFRRALGSLRTKGLRGFLATAVLPRIYRRWEVILIERDLDVPAPAYRPIPGIRICRVETLTRAECQRHMAGHFKVYRRLLDEGCLAFGAYDGADLVGIGWFALKDFHDRDVHHFTFRCREGEAYQFAGFLAPEYRNSAISALAATTAWAHLRSLGFRRFYCVVARTNVVSLRWHTRPGFSEPGLKLITTRLLGLTWARLQPYSGSELDRYRRRPAVRADGATTGGLTA